jgi:hypothetical protein
MEQGLQLAVVLFAALATGGLMVNWIGLGRAMSRLSSATYVEFHQATHNSVQNCAHNHACSQMCGSTIRLRAGQCRVHPMTGSPLVPAGFDFTFSAPFFRFQDWPATFLLVL